jgi:beta-glucosidase
VADLTFPSGFLWGAATAGHQVEGDNRNSDWWAWEQRPGTPVAEPSGAACEHFTRYPQDIALLADAGLNTYRYSVEWSRIEPAEGSFDSAALDHYRAMTQTVVDAGVFPMVTLNHFTVPQWFAARGGWTATDAAALFGRYCEQVVRAIGGMVPWWCTINEPGNVAVGGYLGALGWPPGTRTYDDWKRAARGLTEGHRRALAVVKSLHPTAKVGATHGMIEWLPSPAARPAVEQVRRLFEDAFLEVCGDDDYLGVQSYTRLPIPIPAPLGPVVRTAMAAAPVRERVLPLLLRKATSNFGEVPAAGGDGIRRTQMGYEFWPEAIAATLRRAASFFPGKDLVVTEHGIATADDAERVEFVTRGLAAVRQVMDEGLPVRGYVYWSLLDNFEWTLGFRPTFGLISVDRGTQERTVHPSLRFLGDMARTGRLPG